MAQLSHEVRFPHGKQLASMTRTEFQALNKLMGFCDQDNGVKLDSARVQRLGSDVLELVNSKHHEISQRDWQSVNDILGYYSIVNHVDPDFVEAMKEHSWGFRLTDRSKDCLQAPAAATGLVQPQRMIMNNAAPASNTTFTSDPHFSTNTFRM